MIKSYKYKIKPTVKQKQQLNKTFGCCRFVYNWGLNQKVQTYKQTNKTIGYVELAHQLTQLKRKENNEFLSEVTVESLQQSLRNLDAAFVQFFREKKGFPKFKSKKKSKDSVKFIKSVHFDFDKWKVKIPKCGWVKLCKNKTFDLSVCKIGTLTVSKDHCGDYWCSIVVEDFKSKPAKAKEVGLNPVGIDLGIKDYAILSDGTKYGNPKFLENGQRKLAHLNKMFSRTTNGSRRHETMRIKIARLHRAISNRRSDFLHKLSTDIVNRFDTICLEDLNVEGMLKNSHLANSIQSVAWSEFVRQLRYKADNEGKHIVFIGRFEPSSKTCSKCGYINSELTLSDRKWTCTHCGEVHDRDVNAAVNIRDFALHHNNLIGYSD